MRDKNLERLKLIMGESFDDMEMEDYLSYFGPEKAKELIDVFEKDMQEVPEGEKEETIKKFKKRLEELAS